MSIKLSKQTLMWGVFLVGKKCDLEQRIIELKLEKRELLLAGKNINKIDELIKEVEEEIKGLR